MSLHRSGLILATFFVLAVGATFHSLLLIITSIIAFLLAVGPFLPQFLGDAFPTPTAKAEVLKRFPGAQAYCDETREDRWSIWDDTWEGRAHNKILGVGTSAEGAWENAFENLRMGRL